MRSPAWWARASSRRCGTSPGSKRSTSWASDAIASWRSRAPSSGRTTRSPHRTSACTRCPTERGPRNVYLRSELGDVDWTELEEESGALLAEVLTDEEIDVLGPRIEAMDPISSTSWPLERAAADEDFIYFISAGVDPEKRGSGAFRRLFTPFLEYADEHGLACYLDCYTERLEQLYGHFGFETVERRSIDAFPIEERLMVRRAR